MRYAIISDIHGNLRALEAVLADANKQNIDSYLILGDTIEDFPFPNQIVETVKNLQNVVNIQGNKETYLLELDKQNPKNWVDTQFKPMYWNYQSLTKENLDYLLQLPLCEVLSCEDGQKIHLSHSTTEVFGIPEKGAFLSRNFDKKKKQGNYTKTDFFGDVREEVAKAIQNKSTSLHKGVYLFGHSHLQWHVRMEDMLFINAGSCGVPLDYQIGAPYTVLEKTANGWYVEERLVAYDIQKTIAELKKSDFYQQTKIWSNLISHQLQTTGEIMYLFFDHIHKRATEQNITERPYPNDLWETAGMEFLASIGIHDV